MPSYEIHIENKRLLGLISPDLPLSYLGRYIRGFQPDTSFSDYIENKTKLGGCSRSSLCMANRFINVLKSVCNVLTSQHTTSHVNKMLENSII